MKRLSQIAPIWAQRIKSDKWLDYTEELQDFTQCIVGEAWRYSDQYTKTCDICHEYANDFGVYIPNSKIFNESMVDFEEHFNKEHLI